MLIRSLNTINIDYEHLWERNLMGPGDIRVDIGDNVNKHSIMANMRISILGERMNLAQILDVEPKNVKKYLKCWNGEIVHSGDIIAEKYEKGGMVITEIKVTSSGMLDFSELENGYISVRTSALSHKLIAGLKGKVVGVLPNKKIDIKTDVTSIRTFEILGDTVESVIHYISGKYLETFSKTKLSGKILCTDAHINLKLLKELSKTGIAGLIVNAVSMQDLNQINTNSKHLTKDLGYSIAILSAYGAQPMPAFFSKIFAQCDDDTLVKISKSDNMLYIGDSELFSNSFLQRINSNFMKVRKGLRVKVMGGQWIGHWGKVLDISQESVKVLLDNNQEVKTYFRNLFAF